MASASTNSATSQLRQDRNGAVHWDVEAALFLKSTRLTFLATFMSLGVATRKIRQGHKMFRVRAEDLHDRQGRLAMARPKMSERPGVRSTALRRLIGILLGAKKALSLVLPLGLLVSIHPLMAQEQPKTLAPPEVTMEPNGVNILTGKARTSRPEISIPAAPRLRYSQAADIVMYVEGQQGETTRQAKFSVNYGGERSFTYADVGPGTIERNSDATLNFSLATGGTGFFLTDSGVRYEFFQQEYAYRDSRNLIRYTGNYASRIF